MAVQSMAEINQMMMSTWAVTIQMVLSTMAREKTTSFHTILTLSFAVLRFCTLHRKPST